jgi:hypothetical protein
MAVMKKKIVPNHCAWLVWFQNENVQHPGPFCKGRIDKR